MSLWFLWTGNNQQGEESTPRPDFYKEAMMSRLMRTLLCITALTVLSLALPLASMAGTITVYNNFGPGNAYDPNNGWTESGAGSLTGFNSLQAMAFTNTTGQNIALTQIDIADGFISGNNSMVLSLYADNGSGAPGALMESWLVTSLPSFGTCCTVDTVTSSPGVILSNGGTYWISAASDSQSWEAWNWNTTSASGQGSISTDDGATWASSAYSPNGAFDVLGTAVTPEPTSLLMLGAGMLGLVGVRRKAQA